MSQYLNKGNGRIRPELKLQLKATGYWDAMQKERQGLYYSKILTATKALTTSLDNFLPLSDAYLEEHPDAISDYIKANDLNENDAITPVPKDSIPIETNTVKNEKLDKTPAADRVSLPTPVVGKPASGSGVHTQVALSKEADAVEVIEWVAKHIEVPKELMTDELLSTAPSMTAVGMLKSYAAGPIMKAEFWKNLYAKLIPSKTQLNGREKVEMDGKKIVENIDRIMEMKNKLVLAG